MLAIVKGLAPLARVQIPAGTFKMGSTKFPSAQPVTEVSLSAFGISRTKDTIGQYEAYLRAIGRNRITLAVTDPRTGIVSVVARGETERAVVDQYLKSLSLSEKLSDGHVVTLGGLDVFEVTTPDIPVAFRESPEQPVVCASWFELAAFAAAHGGRHPTEAQYERVMRGRSGEDEFGTSTGEPRDSEGKPLACYGTDRTAKVGSFPPNSWGVSDASGDVWTWTDTWWVDSYAGLETTDPRGPKNGEYRVVRGGSYNGGGVFLRAALRFYGRPVERFNGFGGVVVWPSQDSV